jgi:hypothetical protein
VTPVGRSQSELSPSESPLAQSLTASHEPGTGLAQLPAHHSSVSYPLFSRIKGALVDFALLMLPSSLFRRVGIRIITFEAWSGFTRHRPKQSCYEASAQPVTQQSRLSATGPIAPIWGDFLH